MSLIPEELAYADGMPALKTGGNFSTGFKYVWNSVRFAFDHRLWRLFLLNCVGYAILSSLAFLSYFIGSLITISSTSAAAFFATVFILFGVGCTFGLLVFYWMTYWVFGKVAFFTEEILVGKDDPPPALIMGVLCGCFCRRSLGMCEKWAAKYTLFMIILTLILGSCVSLAVVISTLLLVIPILGWLCYLVIVPTLIGLFMTTISVTGYHALRDRPFQGLAWVQNYFPLVLGVSVGLGLMACIPIVGMCAPFIAMVVSVRLMWHLRAAQGGAHRGEGVSSPWASGGEDSEVAKTDADVLTPRPPKPSLVFQPPPSETSLDVQEFS